MRSKMVISLLIVSASVCNAVVINVDPNETGDYTTCLDVLIPDWDCADGEILATSSKDTETYSMTEEPPVDYYDNVLDAFAVEYIDSCTTIDEPGYYQMNCNITGAGANCIRITADDVIFNGANYTIEHKNPVLGPIIRIDADNVTVRNCKLKTGKWGSVHGGWWDEYSGGIYAITDNSYFYSNTFSGDGRYGIYVEGDGNEFYNNQIIKDFQFSIYVGGNDNLLNKNRALVHERGAGIIAGGNDNIVKNNLLKGKGQQPLVVGGSDNEIINNLIYARSWGIYASGLKDSDLKCNILRDHMMIGIGLKNGCENVVSYHTTFDGTYFKKISGDGLTEEPYVCWDVECMWQGDYCVYPRDDDGDGLDNTRDYCLDTPVGEIINPDGCSCSEIEIPFRDCPDCGCLGEEYVVYPEDGYDYCSDGMLEEYSCSPISSEYDPVCDPDDDDDSILDENDKCPGTVLPENFDLKPNHYADVDGDYVFEKGSKDKRSNGIVDADYTIEDTCGCSCLQILELMPGENKGESKYGCSEGIIEAFMEMKGWAKDLFE